MRWPVCAQAFFLPFFVVVSTCTASRLVVTGVRLDDELDSGKTPSLLQQALVSTSRWYECSYDWERISDAHACTSTWGFFAGMNDMVPKFRREQGIVKKANFTQRCARERLMQMLPHVTATLDRLGVNWYISFGSILGFLRSHTDIPWDEDVDVDVRVSQRIDVFNFIKDGPGVVTTAKNDNDTTFSVWRLDPENPKFLMMGHKEGNSVRKVLWIDLETEVAIDFCFDCAADSEGYVPTVRGFLGHIEVNIPAWVGTALLPYDGIDVSKQTIPMALNKPGWTCTLYECVAPPPPAVQQNSLADLYQHNATASMGPYYFAVDDDSEVGRCSTPRRLENCSKMYPESEGMSLAVGRCAKEVTLISEDWYETSGPKSTLRLRGWTYPQFPSGLALGRAFAFAGLGVAFIGLHVHVFGTLQQIGCVTWTETSVYVVYLSLHLMLALTSEEEPHGSGSSKLLSSVALLVAFPISLLLFVAEPVPEGAARLSVRLQEAALAAKTVCFMALPALAYYLQGRLQRLRQDSVFADEMRLGQQLAVPVTVLLWSVAFNAGLSRSTWTGLCLIAVAPAAYSCGSVAESIYAGGLLPMVACVAEALLLAIAPVVYESSLRWRPGSPNLQGCALIAWWCVALAVEEGPSRVALHQLSRHEVCIVALLCSLTIATAHFLKHFGCVWKQVVYGSALLATLHRRAEPWSTASWMFGASLLCSGIVLALVSFTREARATKQDEVATEVDKKAAPAAAVY
eukprot:TRINITY_DN34034_c0_g3_i1.p1 TRINITY_DN34034_c0_g3~~TRINITY_DN34034_c0_g3_i1.p1  ORF type:complete len:742 (-),score=123.53 TRINITY_DN34034_c0_g3_i1:154-2379(-)